MSGALFKIKPKFHRWVRAGLREASKDVEGFYLKVDGRTEKGTIEQLFLFLDEFDARQVLEEWANLLNLQVIKTDAL